MATLSPSSTSMAGLAAGTGAFVHDASKARRSSVSHYGYAATRHCQPREDLGGLN